MGSRNGPSNEAGADTMTTFTHHWRTNSPQIEFEALYRIMKCSDERAYSQFVEESLQGNLTDFLGQCQAKGRDPWTTIHERMEAIRLANRGRTP